MTPTVMAIALLLPLSSAPAAAQQACGVDRWPVKMLTDRDARAVERAHPVPTTVSALGQLPIPEIPYPADRRTSVDTQIRPPVDT